MKQDNPTLEAAPLNAQSLEPLLTREELPTQQSSRRLGLVDLQFKRTKESAIARLKTFGGLFLPVALAQLSEVGLEFVNLTYAGHLGDYKYLAGMGFSITSTNVLCQSILIGLSYGFQTLGAQAFGARNYKLYGRYCHQAFLIILSTGICLFPLFFFLGTLLAQLGIDQQVAGLVGKYAFIVYPGFICQAEAVLLRRFFQNQRLHWPQIIPGLLVLPIHICLCQFFSSFLALGYKGIAVAACVSYALKFLFFLLLMLPVFRCVKERETLQPFTLQDFKDWSSFLQVAMPSLLLGMLEWWSYELSTIVCSFVSVKILAAQSAIMNYVIMNYLVSLGASSTLATVVGNAIGMNEPKLAKLYSRDGMLFALSLMLLLVGFGAIFRDFILSQFSQDQDVLELLRSVFYLALILNVLDVLQNAENGILRGLGQVTRPLIVAFIVFYVFFQPLSISLLLTTDLGLQSIWLLVPFTSLLNGLGYLYLIRRINWKELAYLKHSKLKQGEEAQY